MATKTRQDAVLAWHILRDNSRVAHGKCYEVKPGETETFDGEPVICNRGLHASVNLLDALAFAQGSLIRRVELSGKMDMGRDKLAATCRRELWRLTPEQGNRVLRIFARWCAVDVLHLCPGLPEVVIRYLLTGDESLRDAARAAAWDAAWDAARDAAWDAARDAAWDAARDAARAAARDAAWDAAEGELQRMVALEREGQLSEILVLTSEADAIYGHIERAMREEGLVP